MRTQHINKTKFITAEYSTDLLQHDVPVRVDLATLVYPYGNCFSITPPPIYGNTTEVLNTLFMGLNITPFNSSNDISANIYFMDKISSLQIYPEEHYMAGQPLKIRLNGEQPFLSSFRTEISKTQHVPGDPLLDCTEYKQNYSYNDCSTKELLGLFDHILGCHPPLLETDPHKICNKKFNISMDMEAQLFGLFRQVYFHDLRGHFKCKTPCTTYKYTTKFLHDVPFFSPSIIIVFDRTLSVAQSTFSINSQTLLTRLGGSVSSGRTLLWILITLLGACEVRNLLKMIEVSNTYLAGIAQV